MSTSHSGAFGHPACPQGTLGSHLRATLRLWHHRLVPGGQAWPGPVLESFQPQGRGCLQAPAPASASFLPVPSRSQSPHLPQTAGKPPTPLSSCGSIARPLPPGHWKRRSRCTKEEENTFSLFALKARLMRASLWQHSSSRCPHRRASHRHGRLQDPGPHSCVQMGPGRPRAAGCPADPLCAGCWGRVCLQGRQGPSLTPESLQGLWAL